MQYAIAVLRHAVPRNDMGFLERPKFYQNDLRKIADTPLLFCNFSDAQKIRHELVMAPYITGAVEIKRPDYYIITDIAADYIMTCRYNDIDNYKWECCPCRQNEGKPCRECHICLRFMVISDRQYVYNHRLEDTDTIMTGILKSVSA